MMVECSGHLNKSLKESFLRRQGVKPDFLPCFVSFKKKA